MHPPGRQHRDEFGSSPEPNLPRQPLAQPRVWAHTQANRLAGTPGDIGPALPAGTHVTPWLVRMQLLCASVSAPPPAPARVASMSAMQATVIICTTAGARPSLACCPMCFLPCLHSLVPVFARRCANRFVVSQPLYAPLQHHQTFSPCCSRPDALTPQQVTPGAHTCSGTSRCGM